VLHRRRDRRQNSDTLFDLYQMHVEEYRFQVRLNWTRTQYFIVFNAGVLSIAAGLYRFGLRRNLAPLGFLFGLGLLASVLAMFATATQHGYYRTARDGMRRVAARLHLGDLAIATTPGQAVREGESVESRRSRTCC